MGGDKEGRGAADHVVNVIAVIAIGLLLFVN